MVAAVVQQIAHKFFESQCFSRVVPATPLHGLKAVPELSAGEFLLQGGAPFFQKKYQVPGLPLVVRGYTEVWPAMSKWQNISYFGGKICEKFQIRSWGMSLRDYTAMLAALENEHSAEEFSAMTQLGEYYFKHNEDLFFECPVLYDDVLGFPLVRAHASKAGTLVSDLARWIIGLFAVESLPLDFVNGDWIQAVTWIGPPGSKTLLHYDDDPLSLLFQFRGRKHVRMWSSDQSQMLYPNSVCDNLNEYGTRFSRFKGNPMSMSQAEKQAFPLLPIAKYLDVVLHPGDMLYIPSGWWHYVSVWGAVYGESDKLAKTSLSVAARSYSTCEGLSYLPSFIANWIHEQGIWDMRGFCITPAEIK